LPTKPTFLWRKVVFAPGAAGLAATEQLVIVADRDPGDTSDTFRALAAADGSVRWTLRYPAAGKLDYGNAPRATPLVVEDKVYLYGAFGHLHCVELDSGNVVWKKNVRQEFNATDDIPWGMCSSPLVVDGKLIVNPGGPEASLVALDPATGRVVWQTPGESAAFSSLVVATLGGKRQIVGYDKTSLGGWDIETGTRLWSLVPPNKSDVNVPTPIVWQGSLIVSSENNGTRLYRFHSDGTIDPQPAAQNADLAPDSHTPVLVGDRLFGVWENLYCLDARAGLKTVWTSDDRAFQNYATAVGTSDRVLIVTQEGELVLLARDADRFEPVSRLRLFDDDPGVYAHPAFVGGRMYLRNSSAVYCLDLEAR
jgi:outer membrane protein assembly factor BamB